MKIRSTTILSVRREGKVVVAGDGQVSLGNTVMKSNAKKVRRMHNDKVVAGFAGSAADGIALFERLEGKLKESNGNLTRAAVDMAKDAYENSGDTLRDGSQAVAKKVQDNPLGALLVAGGIGFALAMLMTRPPRRPPQRWRDYS